MEKSTKRHHVPVDERVKDIRKDSVKELYANIINSMKEREVKASELETKKTEIEKKRQILQKQRRMERKQEQQLNVGIQEEDNHVMDDCAKNLTEPINITDNTAVQLNTENKEEKKNDPENEVDDSCSNNNVSTENVSERME